MVTLEMQIISGTFGRERSPALGGRPVQTPPAVTVPSRMICQMFPSRRPADFRHLHEQAQT